ncbi:MAG: hypothetical protein ACRDH9_07435 [Actinomycetota bacterium]
MRRLLPLMVTALLATACGDGSSSKAAPRSPELSRLDLDEIVLQQDEAPEGTSYLAERSGLLELDDLWPSDCCPGQQVLFEEAGFETAYAGVFEKPGYSGEPIDTRPGWELVSSAAVLFETTTGASSALGAWLAYYESPVLDRLPTDDLGEEGIGLMGSPNAPAEIFYLYLWRVDRAVFSVRVSAGAGTVSSEEVRALVDLMYARIS